MKLMDAEKLFRALKAWGCDIAAAKERFDNDDELYLACLEIFSKDQNFTLLVEQIEKGDYTGAFDSTHSLKGVAGNLSLDPIFAKISLTVEALRGQNYELAKELYPQIITAQNKLCKILAECA